jgi:hypothetical protein
MNMYAGQQVDILASMAFAIMCAWTSRSGCMNIIISLQWILNISSLWLVFHLNLSCMVVFYTSCDISFANFQWYINLANILKFQPGVF